MLWVQPAVAVGGAERQASLVLPLLAAHGLEATCVAGPGREILEWCQARKLERFQWDPRFPGQGDFSLRRLPRALATAASLMHALDQMHAKTPFDVVVGSLGFGWGVSGVRARAWGIPAVWRAGGLSLGAPGSQRAAAWWLGRLNRIAPPDVLLCNADAVARFWGPILRVPTHVVTNGVDLPPASDPRPRGPELLVGFLGRLAPEKNLPLLLEAVAIARARGTRLRVVVAGPGHREALLALARRLGIVDAVELCGPVRDVARFHSGLDAFVLASDHEGCPNALLEAMSHGLPVVATAVGGTPELVTHGYDGLLVPPQHPWALATALEALARDPSLGRRLGANARERAASLSPERCAEGIAELLHTVVERRQRVPLHVV